MIDRQALAALRQHPTEWRRRGLTPPDELAAIVAARLHEPMTQTYGREPAYADFFAAA